MAEFVISEEGHVGPGWDPLVSIPRTLVLAATFALVAIAVLTVGPALAENTAPEVVLETPEEGARLAMAVVVSGTATDAEGFNTSSRVEMRWNTWEWFTLPSNPGGDGRLLHFGETVDLAWHAPGEHTLLVRAYDGELFSQEVNITVTVRDLPDLVVLPSDVVLDPEDAEAGEEAHVRVRVCNQGGEDVATVEVVLREGDRELARETLDGVPAAGSAEASFELELEEGNLTLLVTVNAIGQVLEKSQANNFAEVTFEIPGSDTDDMSLRQLFLLIAIVAIFLLLVFSAMARSR